ncbi:neurexin-1a-like isoform X9 [Brachionus plicatilis]|uniref:Neurexin-1a-like isoform X9 n=1 Tax=Brachionus plicatilis TaxID=10195 RepID=A0A3M7PJQ2_BRAPC|nr:neurexin-1a-like isoform X9 [Brachionus plicatilis]
MVLSVEDGRLKCVYDRQNNDKVMYAGDVDSFNNNKWHTVHLVRTGASIQLQLTDSQGLKHVTNDNLGEDFDLIAYSHVIIGGARSPSLVQEHSNFIGWIQNLNLNGQHLFHNYLNSHLPSWSHSVDGYADPGENSILLHHQITLASECVITLPRVQSTNKLTIHLFFKTTQENGVILFGRGKQFRFVALEMRTGRLRFVFDLGAGLKQVLSPHILNDKNWHEVTIHRLDRQNLALKIDDYRQLSVDTGTSSPGVSELEAFTIGGLVPGHQKFEPHVLTTQGFTGCLASVELNGHAADFYSNRLNMCASVQQGCVDLACSSDTCSNNGQCSVLNGQVACNCDMTSYTGAHCRDNSDYFFFGKTSQQCGLIKHALVPPLVNQHTDQLAFGFTTLDTDALLVRVEGLSQYMDIRLSGGHLTIVLNLNNLEERFVYSTLEDKKFNDNAYHVVQFVRQNNLITFQVDNFEQIRYTLQSKGDCVFQSEQFVYIGSMDIHGHTNAHCFYGIITGVFFNQIHVLNEASEQQGDVAVVDYRYIVIDIDVNRNRTRPLLADMSCPLGYSKQIDVCIFSICPLNSDQIADSCSCYQGYQQMGSGCIRRNETSPAGVVGSSAKLIPAKTASWETPIGLILGIISGIALALLAAGIGARKCSDGLCVPAARANAPKATTTGAKVASMFSSTTNTTNQSYEMNTGGREQVPLIHSGAETKFCQQEELMAKDTLDMGYNYFPQPVVTQSVNETMEMYEQTLAGAGGTTTTVTTYALPTVAYNSSHGAHHASQRDIAMSSMLFAHNNTEYELSNVNCVTMTPNGKYAIIGQSSGAPQIWDTLSGQLVRTMAGPCSNCSCLSLACNGSLLVGLSNEGPAIDSPIQSVQIWEVQTGKPIQMSHQIKCCVFQLSQDTSSIYMAGNQRFGRGISVGILDLVTFELTKEVKSDPTLSLGDNPESVVVTPDERHAIVGCRYATGTNFVVFDLTKASEIGQTRSIAFDADPKCIGVLNNGEVITGTRGGHLIQWNIHTCQITTTYVDQGDSNAHRGPVNQVDISGDKEHLVSGSSDGTVKVWNTINKSLVSVLNGHRGEVTCVSISNNDLIVSGSTDQTVALWRLFGASQISSMPVGMNLVEVNMAKHNKTIVAIGEKDGEQQLLMLRVINVQRVGRRPNLAGPNAAKNLDREVGRPNQRWTATLAVRQN